VRDIAVVKGCAVVLTALLWVTGCGRVASPGNEGKVRAEDLQAAQRAIAPAEVSLMVRSGHNQSEIVKQIEQRRLTAKVDARTEEVVRRFGASPVLIQALKNDANVLSPSQQRAYQGLVAEREARAEATPLIEPGQVQSQPYALERQRRQQLAEQTLKNAQTMEDRVTLYDKAYREYTIRKGQLEYQIAKEQAYLNQARGRGAGDDVLAERMDALEKYKLELSQLNEPAR
jgi:hypothetical protein